jgi:hypothetical protein
LELASDVLALSLALNIVTPTGQLKWVLLSKLPLVRRFTEARTVLVLVEAEVVNVAAVIVTVAFATQIRALSLQNDIV